MGDLYVVPICLGYITRDKSLFTLYSGMGQQVLFPIISYYIGGAEATVLVDTGTSQPDQTAQVHFPYSQTKEETLIAHLKRLGLAVDDVEVVINTHLHWDHCSNNGLLQKARFYVQQEELQYASSPLPIHAHGYDSQDVGLKPPFAHESFEVVRGDAEILPGVSVILTPGHTPGCQGVLVECPGGVFIAGDTIPLFENWEGTSEYPFTRPNGVYTNLNDYYKTFHRIAEIAKEVKCILPGHDSKVFRKSKYP